ncbi:MAG: uroporphyrinogen-III synthase, partial [Cyanobacteria bacterium P01_F01_bin.42]
VYRERLSTHMDEKHEERDEDRLREYVFTLAEVEALKAADCEVLVWPGVSSALAAPLMVGIPITDKDVGQSVALLSGHALESLDWSAIAQLDTAIILMGARNLAEICHRLTAAGRSPDTPVAVIRWCSWPQQESWFGDLATIAERLAAEYVSPAVVVVGDVVNLRQPTQPLQNLRLPLQGKKVIVTRAAGQVSQFRDRLQALGAQVLEMPALEIVPPSSWQGLDDAIANLSSIDWLILTSGNAVEYFFGRLRHHGKDSRALGTVKVAVVGRKTAAQLAHYGIRPDYIPPSFVADSLVTHFPEASLQGRQILFPRVESGGRDVLVREFREQGAEVLEVAAYQSRCPLEVPQPIIAAFREREVDVITFASSKTVVHFEQLIDQALEEINPGQSEAVHSVAELLEGITIASIGPMTTKSCVDLLGQVSLEATEYTLEGLSQSIVEFYS